MDVRKRLSETEKAVMLEALAPIAERHAALSRRSQALLAAAGQDAPALPGAPWYVLTVQHNTDKAVDKALDDNGIEHWMAAEKVAVTRRKGARQQAHLMPALPGYMFVRIVPKAENWVALREIDGVAGVLGGFDRPSPIADRDMLKIKVFMKDNPDAIALLTNALKAGDSVLVEEGAFASFPGVVEEVMESGRAVIEVMIFGRAVPVELDLAQVSKL